MLSASTLYAATVDPHYVAKGKYRCHWCGTSCEDALRHDDPWPQPFSKTKTSARCPSEPFVCKGCWLWRRKRITIQWLESGFRDGQAPENHSWWITKDGSWTLNKRTLGEGYCMGQKMYDLLLTPPTCFCLTLIDGVGIQNHLHHAVCNNLASVKADTVLGFTLNNIYHSWTVIGLEHALTNGTQGTDPGVQALVRLFGPMVIASGQEQEKLGKGRPKKDFDQHPNPLKRKVS